VTVWGKATKCRNTVEKKEMQYVSGKSKFFKHFRAINSAAGAFNSNSPRTAFLLRCHELGITPEPLGVVRTIAEDTSYLKLK